jgi:hypothetical protein
MKSTLHPQKSAHTHTHKLARTHASILENQNVNYNEKKISLKWGPETADRSCLPDVPGQLVPCDGRKVAEHALSLACVNETEREVW